MGGDLELRKWLKEHVCPDAFSTDAFFFEAADAPWVYIWDVLTALHRERGPQFDYTFSPEQLVELVLRQPLTYLQSGDAVRVCVLCADDVTRVPKEKSATQDRRTAQYQERRRKSGLHAASASGEDEDFYPADAKLTAAGIGYTDPATGDWVQDARVNLERLLRSRDIRPQIWHLVREALAKPGSRWAVPHGKALILDHAREGPWAFVGGEPERVLAPHPHGEGEVMAAYWAAAFRGASIVVDTIDTDIIPLLFQLLGAATEPPRRLLWRYRSASGPLVVTHVDMKQLFRALQTKTGLGNFEFLVAFVLCGTDFFPKASVLHHLGTRCMLHAVRAGEQHLADLLEVKEGLKAFRMLLRLAYHEKLSGGGPVAGDKASWARPCDHTAAPPSLDRLRQIAASDARLSFPTDDTVREAYKAFCFNVEYWSLDPAQAPRYALCNGLALEPAAAAAAPASAAMESPPPAADASPALAAAAAAMDVCEPAAVPALG